MKIDRADFKQAAEKSQSCGFSSWPLNSWLDVTGHECRATPEKGGVWTSMTQPGEGMLRAHYVVIGESIVFTFADGEVAYQKATAPR